MDGLGVDEGDGEALRCQLDGKVNCWDDMALKRKGYEDDMGFLVCLCHITMRVLLQGGRGREGGRRVCYKKRELEIYGEVVCMEKSFGYNHRERNKYKENKEIKKRKLKNIYFF